MITIKAGKLFVEKYNEENGTNLTPKEVCCMLAEKAFKGGRHMINWTNSPFFGYLKEYRKFLDKKKKGLDCEEPSFTDAVDKFCDYVENRNCGLESALNVYGGCAEKGNDGDILPTTEFNYCDNIHFTIDERYCSFIGSFFQMCISGFSTVLNNKDLIWVMYESFNEYYKYIHENDVVEDKHLPAWNGCYFYQKMMPKPGFIDKKIKGNSIGTLSYLEFLEVIARNKDFKIKNLIFECFGNTNTTAGCVTLDLDDVYRWLDIMEKVVTNIDEEFDLEKYSKLFSKGNLLRMSFEAGEVTSNMLDPLYDFKRRRSEEEYKNKEGIKFLKIYLKYVMTTKEMELAKQFGAFLKDAPGRGKKSPSVKEEIKNIFSNRSLTKFGDAVFEFCKKTGVDPTIGTPFDVVTYFSTDNNATKLPEFVMYTKFNMKESE
jgi:hypothetical protein